MLYHFDPMTLAQLAILMGAGVSAAGGQWGITTAYRTAAPRDIAVYDYTNILFAALLGFLVFDQRPDIYSWIGFAIIISMAIVMYKKKA